MIRAMMRARGFHGGSRHDLEEVAMPRVLAFAAFVTFTLLTLLVATVHPDVSAQDATPGPAAAHPFVGAWIVDTDVNDDANLPALAVATTDGTYMESRPDVGVGVGTWKATGVRTAELTIVFRAAGEFGAPVGLITAHATIDVSATGDVWEAPYRFEEVTPDGTLVFAGERQSRAVRLGAETVAGLATPGAATPAPLRVVGDRLADTPLQY
jgi:hypothetical protein